MDIIRQVGKNLKKTQKHSDFAIQRVRRNFPVLEKIHDYVTNTYPFRAEFKTYFKQDQVYLTIQIKPDIIGVAARPVCNAFTDIGFGQSTDPDIWGNISSHPIGDPGTFTWAGTTPSYSIIRGGTGYPDILTKPDGVTYRDVNGNETWGVASKVYLEPGTHLADFTVFLDRSYRICKVLFVNGSLFGFHGFAGFSFEGGGTLITSVQPGVVYEINAEMSQFTVHYANSHSVEGPVFVPGQDIRYVMLWESDYE